MAYKHGFINGVTNYLHATSSIHIKKLRADIK